MSVTITYNNFALTEANGITISEFAPSHRASANSTAKLMGHGANLSQIERGGQAIRIAGLIRGGSISDYGSKKDALLNALTTSTPSWLQFNNREIRAVLAGDIQIDTNPLYISGLFSATFLTTSHAWRSVSGNVKTLSITEATRHYFDITNSGNAPARWRAVITTTENITDSYIEFVNASSGKILRISGFDLTTDQQLIVDTGYDQLISPGVYEGSGGFPSDSFGIQVVDGSFWALESGVNILYMDTNEATVKVDIFWYHQYYSGENES